MENTHDYIQDEVLAGQIPEYAGDVVTSKNDPVAAPVEESPIGKKLSFIPGAHNNINAEEAEELTRQTNMTQLGGNLRASAEAREGWITINRDILGERDKFYPSDWQFLIRPATVEAIRNWSLLDENNANSIDDVFNEILKYCLSIKTSVGNLPWQAINNWDRFFFVLIIREYTFVNGESNIEFYEDCYNCDSAARFTLESQSLMYDLPDESVMEYFDRENRVWIIDPNDYDVQSENPVYLYVPTIERDANIKAWLISEYQQNEKKKFDNVFIKFLPWLVPKISKDTDAAKMQIRKAELAFRSWDSEMFSFMNDVLKNISVTPSTNISAICPSCGEEVTTRLRFPNGVGALFNVVNRRSKFGTK